MSFTRINVLGWSILDKLASTQINAIDIQTTYALDKRAGQTDTLESVVSTSGAGRVTETSVVGADANTTYATASGIRTIRPGTLTADRTYTLSNTGAVTNDRVTVLRVVGYTLTIQNAALATLSLVNSNIPWAEFNFNGTAWELHRVGVAGGNNGRSLALARCFATQ